MASIAQDPNNRKRILFVRPDGKRVSIRLGKTSKRNAEAVKLKIESIVSARIAGHAIDDESARWVAALDESLSQILSNVGLIPKRESEALGPFVDSYISGRTDVKPSSRKAWRQARDHLVDFFGEGKPLRELTRVDGAEWRLSLYGKGLAEASVRKYCGYVKQFLSEAAERELIPRNPFAKLVSSSVSNSKRQYFVTREETDKVIAACPDAEWRLIVALSRYVGLRCPSEHCQLRWEDILWEQQRIIVHSPKTERHEGHESRIVPLFPELLPYLEDAFEVAERGAEYVLRRFENDKSGGANLRTQLTRIIKRAGLKPWARITHNMRSSRQTELEDAGHPSHVVCAWLGNSQDVARKHYLQVTDDHFTAAVAPNKDDNAKAAQNAAQYGAELGGIGENAENDAHEKTPVLQGFTDDCDSLRQSSTGVDGNRTHLAPFQRPHWV